MVGEPIAAPMAALLDQHGIPAAGASAMQVTVEQLRHARLVLTMTRRHRSDVATLNPSVMRRAFTLLEFAAIVSTDEAIDQIRATDPVERLTLATEWAARHRFLGPAAGAAYDVVDPYGRSKAMYRASLGQIEPAVAAITRFTLK